MANISGPGGMNQVELLVSYKDSQKMTAKNKDGQEYASGVYLMVQKLNANKATADPHPFLNPIRDGKPGSVLYKQSQFEALESAAGANKYTDKNGVNYMTIKADITKTKQGKLIMNIPVNDAEKMAKHPLTPSEHKLDGRLIARHNKNTEAAREALAAKQAEKQAAKEAPAKEAEAEAELG